MIPDVMQIATQIQTNLALQEGRVKAAEEQLARVQIDIDQARDEKAKVVAECHAACEHAQAMKREHETAAKIAYDELAKVKAQIAAHEAALHQMKDEHQQSIAQLKGQYRATLAGLEEQVSSLSAKRDSLKAEIAAVIAKYSR
jgi:chromosome segregation ATPase